MARIKPYLRVAHLLGVTHWPKLLPEDKELTRLPSDVDRLSHSSWLSPPRTGRLRTQTGRTDRQPLRPPGLVPGPTRAGAPSGSRAGAGQQGKNRWGQKPGTVRRGASRDDVRGQTRRPTGARGSPGLWLLPGSPGRRGTKPEWWVQVQPVRMEWRPLGHPTGVARRSDWWCPCVSSSQGCCAHLPGSISCSPKGARVAAQGPAGCHQARVGARHELPHWFRHSPAAGAPRPERSGPLSCGQGRARVGVGRPGAASSPRLPPCPGHAQAQLSQLHTQAPASFPQNLEPPIERGDCEADGAQAPRPRQEKQANKEWQWRDRLPSLVAIEAPRARESRFTPMSLSRGDNAHLLGSPWGSNGSELTCFQGCTF